MLGAAKGYLGDEMAALAPALGESMDEPVNEVAGAMSHRAKLRLAELAGRGTPWAFSWHSVMLTLLLHVVLYLLVAAVCAFFAARQFRRLRDPERQSLRTARDKGVEAGQGEPDAEEDSIAQELRVWASDPVPFLRATADADDDAVQLHAGLDARLYLRMLWVMMILFSVLAGVTLCVMLPLNVMADKASWYPENSFLMCTANGFAHPESALLFHTMFSVFVAMAVCGVVYVLRSEILAHVKGIDGGKAVPPVHAYTVEVQGLRLDPPVDDREIYQMLDGHAATRGQVLDVQTVLDVTDLVDVVENARLLRSKLARYREQHERDGQRPRVCVGMFSWLYLGEWVDALDHAQAEIEAADREASALRQKPARMGTGTAFITFHTRQAAMDCIEAFGNVAAARERCGFPTVASTRGAAEGADAQAAALPLCRNADQWLLSMAAKPEDVYWRNLRFSRWHHMLLSVTGFLLIVLILGFIVTPIFLVQLFLAVGEEAIDGATKVSESPGTYEAYYVASSRRRSMSAVMFFVAGIVWPLLVLCVNFIIMPSLVHYVVRFYGHRQVSAMRRSAYGLICFFMVTNLLVIPGLSLSGFDQFLAATTALPLDRLLAQILFFGSSGSFFVDYVAQAGLLTAAFYFLYHTTSPLLVDWASGGNEKRLIYEFDFAYFYSSILAVIAIGLMFASTVPIVVPFVAAVCVLRYYTDKWQLLTAHSTLRRDPSPEMTASATHFALLLVTAFAQAAFSSWLWVQGARLLAVFPMCACCVILLILVVPLTRDQLVVVNPRWDGTNEGLVEQPETMTTPAPMSYKGAYENPYLKDDYADRTSRLWGALGGVY